MVKPQDMSDEDWQVLIEAPWGTGIGVMAADPGGPGRASREMDAVMAALREVEHHGAESDLVRWITDDVLGDKQYDSVVIDPHAPDAATASLSLAERVRVILDEQVSPAESLAVRTWLMHIAAEVAMAAKEGGFLGFGGTRVSEAEHAHLVRFAEVLGVEVPPLD